MPNHVISISGCQYTIAIALPGSILDNAQSPELRTYLAGQVISSQFLSHLFNSVFIDQLLQISL